MLSGMDRARQVIKSLINKLDDCSEVFKRFRTEYQKTIKDAFTTQGATFGKKWAAYSPSYRKWKQKHGNKPKLRLSEKLFEATQGGPGWFERIGKKDIVIGITSFIPYARIHQRGGDAGKGNRAHIPQRAFFMNYDNKTIPVRALNFLADDLTRELNRAAQ